MAEKKIAVDLIINKAEAAKSMGDVKAALKEIKSAMLEVGEEGGKDFNNLAAAASQLKEKVKDADEKIAAMKNGGLGGINQIAQGAGVAIQGMTSAMALFGAESEDVQKTMMKVQAAMAFGQAIAGIEEMGKAFGALFTLIEANPIGALITLVAGLTVGIYEFYKSEKEANSEVAKATKAYELQQEATKNLNAEYDREISKLEAQGASEKDIIDVKKKKIDAMIAEIKASADLHLAKIKDIKDNDDLEESYWRATEAALRKIGADEKADAIEKLIQAKKAERAKADIDATKDALDQIATLKQDRENLDIELQRHEIDRIKDTSDKKVKIWKGELEEFKSINRDMITEQVKTNVQFNDEMYKQMQKEGEEAKRAHELKMKYAEMEKDFAISSASSMFSSLSSLTKKHAKLSKAFAIAQTIIDTYSAAQKAYASQLSIPTPDAPIRAQIAAGIAILSGLARVNQIKGVDENGGGGSVSMAGAGGGMAGLTSVVGGGGTALGQPETLLNPNGTPQQQQSQQVYVVESHITSTQRRVQVIENLNRFH